MENCMIFQASNDNLSICLNRKQLWKHNTIEETGKINEQRNHPWSKELGQCKTIGWNPRAIPTIFVGPNSYGLRAGAVSHFGEGQNPDFILSIDFEVP